MRALTLTVVLFAGILTQWFLNPWGRQRIPSASSSSPSVDAELALRPFPLTGSVLLIPLSGPLLWDSLSWPPAEGVYRWENLTALLKWGTNLVLFFLALQIFSTQLSRPLSPCRSLLGRSAEYHRPIQMFSSWTHILALFQPGAQGFRSRPVRLPQSVCGLRRVSAATSGSRSLRRPPPDAHVRRHGRRAVRLRASVRILRGITACDCRDPGNSLIAILNSQSRVRRRIPPSPTREKYALILLAVFALAFTAVVGWQVLLQRFSVADPCRRPPRIPAYRHDPRPPLDRLRPRNLVHSISGLRHLRQRPLRESSP